MHIAKPYTALSPTLDGAVLNALAGTTRPLTGREVARLTGRRSHRGVALVLDRLVEHGLVERVEAGNAQMHTLNRDHLAAPAVEVLTGVRSELLARLRKAIGSWKVAPLHISLFGSAARGEGNAQSDIDLFVVRAGGVEEEDSRWRGQLRRLAADVGRWTGNHVAVVEVAADEIGQLTRDEPPVVKAVRAEGVLLAGAELSALLERGA